jgi:hypothetical protein
MISVKLRPQGAHGELPGREQSLEGPSEREAIRGANASSLDVCRFARQPFGPKLHPNTVLGRVCLHDPGAASHFNKELYNAVWLKVKPENYGGRAVWGRQEPSGILNR